MPQIWPCAAVIAGLLLAGCNGGDAGQNFPPADRPVAKIVADRWSNEEARDRQNEADQIMDMAGIRPGMTVADIGAGEGYYAIRLSERVGAKGRVLAHNHPSGNPQPSQTDKRATQTLCAMLRPLGVNIADHIILAGDDRFSFRDLGLL